MPIPRPSTGISRNQIYPDDTDEDDQSDHYDNENEEEEENEDQYENENEENEETTDSGSETSSYSSGDSVNSDDEEYFIRFESTTGYDNVDYVMIGSTCYEFADAGEQHERETECISECQHDVLVNFINGYIDQSLMNKDEIQELCRQHGIGIDISNYDVFHHLLE